MKLYACCVYIAYAVLGIDGAMYMLDMWCYVRIVLCTCWICGVVCIWCYAHVGYAVLCTYGAMYIWCCVHDCTCGVVYMLYMWSCMQVVSCTCDDVHTLYRYCCVQVVLCTHFAYGTSIHEVLCACRTCCVAEMWNYVCAWYSRGIVTCVFVVLYSIYVYVLCYVVHQM